MVRKIFGIVLGECCVDVKLVDLFDAMRLDNLNAPRPPGRLVYRVTTLIKLLNRYLSIKMPKQLCCVFFKYNAASSGEWPLLMGKFKLYYYSTMLFEFFMSTNWY